MKTPRGDEVPEEGFLAGREGYDLEQPGGTVTCTHLEIGVRRRNRLLLHSCAESVLMREPGFLLFNLFFLFLFI